MDSIKVKYILFDRNIIDINETPVITNSSTHEVFRPHTANTGIGSI